MPPSTGSPAAASSVPADCPAHEASRAIAASAAVPASARRRVRGVDICGGLPSMGNGAGRPWWGCDRRSYGCRGARSTGRRPAPSRPVTGRNGASSRVTCTFAGTAQRRGDRGASRPRTRSGRRPRRCSSGTTPRANASNCAGCTAESTLNPSTAPASPHASNSAAISTAVPTTIDAFTDAATTRCRRVGGRSPDGLRPVRSATISTSSCPAALKPATSAGVTGPVGRELRHVDAHERA